MRKIILSCLLLLPATAVHAQGDGGTVLVDQINVIQGRIYVYSTNMHNPDNCATSEYFILPEDNAGRDLMLSLLLTAKTTKSTISLWLDGCSISPWHSSAPVISALSIN